MRLNLLTGFRLWLNMYVELIGIGTRNVTFKQEKIKIFQKLYKYERKETKTGRANRKIMGRMLHTFNICSIYM